MLIAGTLPEGKMPLTIGEVSLTDTLLAAGGRTFGCTQGTGTMITAALTVTGYFGLKPPHVIVAGDMGDGKGTKEIYQHLPELIDKIKPRVLVLHYCLPVMAFLKRLCTSVRNLPDKPFMIADAGAMYAAKAAGLASDFDIFTPDPSEMAFLADPLATHPAYVSKHLFSGNIEEVPAQIAAAFMNKAAAKLLLVKGKIDHIAVSGKVLAIINSPDIPHLEPIGGTGDTITGLVSALIYAGLDPAHAAIIAAKTNRTAGLFALPTPATTAVQIIEQFPLVLGQYWQEWTSNQLIATLTAR
ncbi:MAG: sugar kinase [Syntrophales bacterium]|nr:sugar kinase [Syntrophales bacterium]MDY0044461.1 NAD(P)H-hydrate dehydratase [Syntrophales bacterium]